MPMVVDLKPYFTRARIAKRFEAMPPLKSTIMDRYFPEAVRDQYEMPIIPLQVITAIVNAVPVVARGAESVSIDGRGFSNQWVEPLPVRIHTEVGAKDLNDLKLIGEDSREAWATRRQEAMRQTVRLTTEALCCQALLNGAVNYPLLQSNGQFINYKVEYNNEVIQTISVAAASKWNAAECTMVKVFELLEEMADALDGAGYGGDKDVLAGKNAFSALLALIEDAGDNQRPKVPARINEDGSVNIGGHKIAKMAEVWRNPQSGASVAKVPPGEIRMIAKGYTGLIYAAVDDLDANLQALPMFVKPVERKNPSGYQLVAESKPLPAVAPKAVARAIVTA
ncbi:major capsid protein [Desulfarculus baarsii]